MFERTIGGTPKDNAKKGLTQAADGIAEGDIGKVRKGVEKAARGAKKAVKRIFEG